MKIILKYTWQLICCVLVILLLLQRQCTRDAVAPVPAGSHTVATTYDTIPVYDTIPKHVPELVIIDTVYPEFPFDTMAFVADYLSIKIADDTLRGENYMIAIRDVITRNKIQSRKATATINVLKETIHVTDSIPYPVPAADCIKPRNKIYAGIGIGGWTDKVGFAPTIALNTKKDNLYTASYDVINRTAWLSIYWKIHIKK